MEDNHVINTALIALDVPYTTKKDIINAIAQMAKAAAYIEHVNEFVFAVEKREAEVSTAIGYHVAIPHGKSSVVLHPFIAFMRTSEPIIWSEGDDEAVQLVFLIGVPEKNTETLHLKFISQVSRKLLDETFRDQLTTLKDKQKVYELLCAIEA